MELNNDIDSVMLTLESLDKMQLALLAQRKLSRTLAFESGNDLILDAYMTKNTTEAYKVAMESISAGMIAAIAAAFAAIMFLVKKIMDVMFGSGGGGGGGSSSSHEEKVKKLTEYGSPEQTEIKHDKCKDTTKVINDLAMKIIDLEKKHPSGVAAEAVGDIDNFTTWLNSAILDFKTGAQAAFDNHNDMNFRKLHDALQDGISNVRNSENIFEKLVDSVKFLAITKEEVTEEFKANSLSLVKEINDTNEDIDKAINLINEGMDVIIHKGSNAKLVQTNKVDFILNTLIEFAIDVDEAIKEIGGNLKTISLTLGEHYEVLNDAKKTFNINENDEYNDNEKDKDALLKMQRLVIKQMGKLTSLLTTSIKAACKIGDLSSDAYHAYHDICVRVLSFGTRYKLISKEEAKEVREESLRVLLAGNAAADWANDIRGLVHSIKEQQATFSSLNKNDTDIMKRNGYM